MTIQQRTRNFAAKHSKHKSGAGLHRDKQGVHASRNRQKRKWQQELKEL